MTPFDDSQFREHLNVVSTRWSMLLERNSYECALIYAGSDTLYYDDDQTSPFHANPYFLQWTVSEQSVACVLLFDLKRKPRLLWYCPDDFWYIPSEVPSHLTRVLECEVYKTVDALESACVQHLSEYSRVAMVGPHQATYADQENVEIPSETFFNQLAYLRAYKTEFEITQIEQSTERALKGHRAAYRGFRYKKSEFEINADYLAKTNQLYVELPYPNIVALNTHGRTLHYNLYDREPPKKHLSLLIDAGAKSWCYHSDITRTYSNRQFDVFADLVGLVDDEQQQLVNKISSFKEFSELHEAAHLAMGRVLHSQGVLTCTPESAFEQELTDVFYPHGTGHLIGLQTHDVGGHIVDLEGNKGQPPDRFPSLRLIRHIEPDMVFTVEPGVYFIPLLLDKIRGHKDVDWSKVEELMPYGGVRIEDNVFVHEGGVRNITREVEAQLDLL